MAIYPLAVQHSWLREDGLVENAVVNTFSFIWDTNGDFATPDLMGDEVVSRLQDFYAHFADDISSYMTGDQTVKIYSRNDPEPRVPVYTDTHAPPAVSGSRAPGEIALCLSFRGTIVSGEPPARRRGRVYLGPFGPTAFVSVTSGTRPTTDLIGEMVDAGAELMAYAAGNSGLTWGIYSPTDDLTDIVVAGWVDNAFDTMRSRGIAPSARSTF